ncbi:MAG TPA: hypothetical protein VI488_17505 [Candidatus Angelobacter sp.]
MKHFAMLSAAVLLVAAMPAAGWGQVSKPPGQTENKDHGNMGVYFGVAHVQGYTLFGVGGRMGFNVHRRIVLEGEYAYFFQRSQTQTVAAGGSSNTITTNLRMWDALFGPKINITKHFFALAKAGMADFGVSGPAPPGGINNQIGGIVNGNLDKVIYPGGGVEFKVGRVHFRAEAGDEIIWFNNGAHSNLRATIGPQLRF